MNGHDIRKLAVAASARAAALTKPRAAGTAKPAAPAKTPKPAKVASPGPVPPKKGKPVLRVVSGVAPEGRRRLKISSRTLERAKARRADKKTDLTQSVMQMLKPYVPPKGVLPAGEVVKPLAMDSAVPVIDGINWAGNAMIWGNYFEGQSFPGYPILSELMQKTEYRKVCERLSTEMTRKGYKLNSTGDDDKSGLIKEIDDFLKDIKLRECMQRLAFIDAGLGRAHLYVDTDDGDDPSELKTPIGDGRNKFSEKISPKNPIKRLKVVEPTWTYPAAYNANDPLAPDWMRPQTWYVMGKEVHHSRLLTFVGREVPDIFKPAYAFGGLSLTQMMKTFVDNWTSTRQHVNRLIANFSKNGIKTDLMAQMQPSDGAGPTDGNDLLTRIDLYTALSDNNGMMVLDKEGEEFFQFNTPLGTLDQLQAQSLEQLCLPSGMPVVILLGLTPHGLNASSEGEVQAWNEWVKAYQQHFYGDLVTRMICFAQLSLRGTVDRSIGYEWVPLRELNEKEEAELQKAKSDRDCAYIDRSALDPIEVRRRLKADPQSGYNMIDADDLPEGPEEVDGGTDDPDDDSGGAGAEALLPGKEGENHEEEPGDRRD